MTIQFFQQTVTFNGMTVGSDGIMSESVSQKFDTEVRSGQVVLQTFCLSFNNTDYYFELGRVEISNMNISGEILECDVTVPLKDASKNYIDPNTVSASIVYIADVE